MTKSNFLTVRVNVSMKGAWARAGINNAETFSSLSSSYPSLLSSFGLSIQFLFSVRQEENNNI